MPQKNVKQDLGPASLLISAVFLFPIAHSVGSSPSAAPAWGALQFIVGPERRTVRGLRIVMAARNMNLRHMLYNDRNDDGSLRNTYERPQAGKGGHGSEGWDLRGQESQGGTGRGRSGRPSGMQAAQTSLGDAPIRRSGIRTRGGCVIARSPTPRPRKGSRKNAAQSQVPPSRQQGMASAGMGIGKICIYPWVFI